MSTPQNAAAMPNKLRGKTIFFYTCAAVGFNMLWTVQSTFITYYYTQSVGISAAVGGIIALAARLWDGINDPLMGTIADKTKTKFGRYRPYLLWGILPLMAASILLFTSPAGAAMGAKIAYAAVTYVFFGMSYTFINIPYMTMQSTLTRDPDERTKLINLKNIGAMVGAAVGSILTPALAQGLGDRGYLFAMVGYSCVMAIGCVLAFIATKPYINNELPTGDANAPKQKIPFSKQVAVIFQNRPLLIVMLVFILSTITQTMVGQVSLYYTEYYLGRKDLIATMNMLAMVAMILVPILVGVFSKRAEKRTFMMVGYGLTALVSFAQYFVPPTGISVVMVMAVLKGISGGLAGVFIFSMVADCVDYGAWKTGQKLGGTVFSTATFAQKTGAALGAAIIGGILTASGFVSGGGAQAAHTIQGIRVLNTIVPAVVFVIIAVIMRFYPLTKAKMATISQEIYGSEEKPKA